ncbi:cytochrome-c peroxidase [Emticicia sp. BO119]|uniref:cytochrome-c peroxidase n=1 Tax=Emticicia sp. BO119 TaxID=2757768 RepID=UPI0015F09408|nr:cytochrome c peroxidase [Emticicia sp. BO119]MBA4851331.1 cytochrome-c peroxidase [Emticicia sp. BO119]
MNHYTHILPRIKRKWLLLCVALLKVVLSALKVDDGKPEPYPLVYPANFGGRFTIPADNPLTKEGVHLGRMLFYEKQLSADNSLSCGSCHQQKLAFSDGRALSVGVDKSLTSRNAMALVNLLWVRNFFWDGRSASLEDQAVFPMTNPHEMGQSLDESVRKLQQTPVYPALFKKAFGTANIDADKIRKALAQFERTLISADSPYDRYLAGTYQPTSQELRGMTLFMEAPAPERGMRGANCGHCHGGPKTFKELFHNNGLDAAPKDTGIEAISHQASDKGRFRVPTLRNIALTAPYMHDGRFKTLEEVIDHYNEHLQESATLSTFLRGTSNEKGGKTLLLNATEKADIMAFLHMLTDTTFINNPAFSDINYSQKQ